jgi:hypothetical protein
VTDTSERVAQPRERPVIRPGRTGPPSAVRLPPTPRQDDGNHWETGRCWLWCGAVRTRVLWLGPATVAGTTTGFYACEMCVEVLSNQIIAERMGLDVEWGLDHFAHGPPAGRPTGRHRRVR